MDCEGSNLPMILYAMSKEERVHFIQWSQEKFGISFFANPTGGHISIFVNDMKMNGKNTNLTDIGYGYSQVLPIIVLLWKTRGKPKTKIANSHMIVIEQPELHLHPAMQAQLARVFASVVKEAQKQEINIQIVFETHSEIMINELGHLVSEGVLGEQDVNVLTFELDKSKSRGTTIIKQCSFDQDGLLRNWPPGFFSSRA